MTRRTATQERASYTSAAPWDGVGTAVDGCKSVSEALKKAKLTWGVNLVPLTTPRGVEVIGRMGVERSTDGRVLGITSTKYPTFTNKEGLEFMNPILDSGDLILDKAGELKGGSLIWMIVRAAKDEYIEDEQFVSRVLLRVGHGAGEGSAIEAMTVLERVWCQNQIRSLRANAGERVRIVHNGAMRNRLADAQKVLASNVKATRTMIAELGRTQDMKLKKDAKQFVQEGMFGPLDDDTTAQRRNRIEAFQSIYATEKERSGDTVYTLINAITGYADHALRYNGDSAARAEKRMLSVMVDGHASDVKEQGIALLRSAMPEMVRAA